MGNRLNELALFAGAGGGILAGTLCGWRTVCAVEIDKYCRRLLMQRQNDGVLPPFPIWDDVRSFDGNPWREKVDVVTGGFPCQPFSVAGKQKRSSDERNMWPDAIRIIREVRPKFALLENVPGLMYGQSQQIKWDTVERTLFGRIRTSHNSTVRLDPYFATVLGDLAESGFDVRWRVLSAAELGAPHKRDRLWLLAYVPDALRSIREPGSGLWRVRESDSPLADTHRARCEVVKRSVAETWPAGKSNVCRASESSTVRNAYERDIEGRKAEKLERQARFASRHRWWGVEPGVGRVADGVANRVDRLRAIGNGQVSIVAAFVWWLLLREV